MLYIRTDSNNIIATGHVMRCISIAKKMRETGEDCIFITSDRFSNELINFHGFEIICLDTEWSNLDSEIEVLIDIIKDRKIEKLLIDSYSVTEKYLRSIRKYTKLIYIDDINSLIYPVDMLINYSGSYKKFTYDKQYENTTTKLLLGYNYVPLREEFNNIKPIIAENVKKILFTIGGSDDKNITAQFITSIIDGENYKNLQFEIVIGSFNNNLECLNKLILNHDNIKLHYNVSNMANLMNECDIAISAGGTTLFELCACGVPTISFTIANNQKEGTKILAEEKSIIYAGDIYEDSNTFISNIVKNMDMLLYNLELRRCLSKKMNSLVDGSGANRIANEIYLL